MQCRSVQFCIYNLNSCFVSLHGRFFTKFLYRVSLLRKFIMWLAFTNVLMFVKPNLQQQTVYRAYRPTSYRAASIQINQASRGGTSFSFLNKAAITSFFGSAFQSAGIRESLSAHLSLRQFYSELQHRSNSSLKCIYRQPRRCCTKAQDYTFGIPSRLQGKMLLSRKI